MNLTGGSNKKHQHDVGRENGGKPRINGFLDQRNDVYVGNIPSNFNDVMLLELFQAYRIVGVRNFTKQGHKVFGFLKCIDENEVERIVREMNNITVEGRNLILRPAGEEMFGKPRGRTNSATNKNSTGPLRHGVDAPNSKRAPSTQFAHGFLEKSSVTSQEKQPDSRRPPLRLPYGYGRKPNIEGIREHLKNVGPPPLVLCEDRLPVPYKERAPLVLPLGHTSPSGTSSSNVMPHFATRDYALEAASQQLYSRVNPAVQCGYHVPYTACHEPTVLTVSPVSSQCSRSPCCDHTSHNHHHEPMACCRVSEFHSTARTSSSCHSSPPSSDHRSQTKRSKGRGKILQQQKNMYQPAYDDDNDSPGESVVLCVANFPFYTSQDKLYQLFEDFDPLDIDMIENEPMDNPGDFTYALITVPDRETAEAAIFELDNTQFGKRTIVVQELFHEDLAFNDDNTEDYQNHSASKRSTKKTLSDRFSRMSLS